MKVILILLLLGSSVAHAETSPSTAERCVQQYAALYRVPPEMIAAFIDVESRWNPRALSGKGAMGLMQLMPATARRFGAMQPFDAEQNIAAGTRYVTTLMWEFHGDLRLVTKASDAAEIVSEMDGVLHIRSASAQADQAKTAEDIFAHMSAYMEAPAAA